MNPPTRTVIAAGLLLLIPLNVFAGGVKVIANPSVRADWVSSEELRGVFLLQRKTLKDGSSVVPVLEKRGIAHEIFLKQYLDREGNELQTYYQGLVFTGKGLMPKQLDSDTQVLAFVAQTRGAIGYVDGDFSTQGVKVLEVIVPGRSAQRRLLARVEPEYPETLERLRIGGTVRLALRISPTGTVEEVLLLGGNPILGEAAAKAVKQWVYAPASSETKMEISVPFAPRP